MLKRAQFKVLIALGAIGVCLVGTNIGLSVSNRAQQADIQSRAQFVQQTAQLEVLYREIVKGLADLSVKNQDADLRSLLASHGITVTVNPSTPAAASTSPETARRGGGR